jgi:heptosyltransferase-2/heptosyltransferase-3
MTLMVGRSCEDVARHLPYFDEIEILDDRRLMAGGRFEKMRGAFDLLRRLRGGYSDVYIFHRDWRYSVLAWLSRITKRVGFDHPISSMLLTHSYHPDRKEHHSAQYLRMAGCVSVASSSSDLKLCGLWKFNEGELNQCVASLRSKGFDPEGKSWIALGFGGGKNVKTRTDLKNWPLDQYRQLAIEWVARGNQVLWLGDAEDAQALGKTETGLNLAGKLSVPELAAALQCVQMTVTNDTLMLHLSEAVGTPSLAIFGPTEPAHYRPLGDSSNFLWAGVPCSPCHHEGYFPPCGFEHRCMKQISVQEVLSRVRDDKMRLNSPIH